MRLTRQETEVFDFITAPGSAPILLMRATLDGREVAVVCAMREAEDGDALLAPLAVLCDEAMLDGLRDSFGAKLTEVKPYA